MNSWHQAEYDYERHVTKEDWEDDKPNFRKELKKQEKEEAEEMLKAQQALTTERRGQR